MNTETPETATGRDDMASEVDAALAEESRHALNPHAGVDERTTALAKLREELPKHLISTKPVPIPKDDPRNRTKSTCEVCKGYHATGLGHLDYAGHAAITERLLEVDPYWSWRPVSEPELLQVLPQERGGMWIHLTVAGVTRLGYGDAQGKSGHNAVKEIIGDALRNAAMRFGVGLALWHKGDLHADAEAAAEAEREAERAAEEQARVEAAQRATMDQAQAMADEAAQDVGNRDPRTVYNRVLDLQKQAEDGGMLGVTVAVGGQAGPLGSYLKMRASQLQAPAQDREDGESEAHEQAQQDDPDSQ